MHTARRGLTLLEVLASTLLLATVAAACMPLLASAVSVELERDAATCAELDLAALADAFMEDPAGFAALIESAEERWTIQWPDEPDRPAVTVRRLRSREPETGHEWFVFSIGESKVPCTAARWRSALVEAPSDQQEGDTHPEVPTSGHAP